jgi:hypothetical protein
LKWFTPNHKKCDDWTYGELRGYGMIMGVIGAIAGILFGLQF